MSCQRLRHQTQFEKCPSKARAAILRRHSSRQPIQARKRSTRRATDEIEPRDTFQKHTAWRSGGGSPPPNYQQDYTSFNAFKRAKEPFEAELLILFGLPTLIILIPWAVKDPAALAVIPVAFLIPGVRDVLLAVLRSTFLGVRRAKKFMKDDDDDYYYNNNNTGRYTRRSATGASLSGSWSARPPQPQPPGNEGSFYDLSQDDFTVDPGVDDQVIVGTQGEEERHLEESLAQIKEEELDEEEKIANLERHIENVEEETMGYSSSFFSQPPGSTSQRRRWVSYNTSASGNVEDEERINKKNKNRDQSTSPAAADDDDVLRLQSIPASPLADIRWKNRDQQQENRLNSTSSDDMHEQESIPFTVSSLDVEIETLKRRHARAARRQQRLDTIVNSITSGDFTTTATIRTPSNLQSQQQPQQQVQGQGRSTKNRNDVSYRSSKKFSFWGDDDDDSESSEYSNYYFGNDVEGKKNNITSGAGSGRKEFGNGRRRGRGGARVPRGEEVPWYARPIVSLFPFLKDWGGFM